MKSFNVIFIAIFTLIASLNVAAAGKSLTLSGEYTYYTDEMSLEMMGQNICMFPDANTAKLVLRPKGDARDVWFCFTDFGQARVALDIPEAAPEKGCGFKGNITAEVKDYSVNQAENDDFDVATLVKVISHEKPVVIECQP